MGLRGVGEPLGRLAAACTLARRGPSYAATCFPTVDVGRAERHQGPERRGLRRSAAKTATHLRQAPQRVVRRPQACTGRARPTPPRRRMLTKSGRATASESVFCARYSACDSRTPAFLISHRRAVSPTTTSDFANILGHLVRLNARSALTDDLVRRHELLPTKRGEPCWIRRSRANAA